MVLGKRGEFRLAGRVAGRLYEHQLKGVRWLWSLHSMQKGGILGDDMGETLNPACLPGLSRMRHIPHLWKAQILSLGRDGIFVLSISQYAS